MSAVEQIQQRAAEFLLRRDEPDWSTVDQMALDEWLEQSMAHRAAYWRLEHVWQEADRLRSLAGPSYTDDETVVPHPWFRYRLAASLLAVAALTSVLAWPSWRTVDTNYSTRIGHRGVVTLQEGSQIELNTDSRVRVSLASGQRDVWLERGEAYFDVAHDSRRPFIVHSGLRDITVLGTKFVVHREAGRVVVSVVDGKVQLTRGERDQSVSPASLDRGSMAIAQQGETLVMSGAFEQIDDALAWRQGKVVFRQTTLAEAAEQFNRYNQQKLRIADPNTGRMLIGGSFRAGNVRGFADLLSTAYKLQIDVSPTTIKISQR